MDPITTSFMAIGTGSASGLKPYLTVLILGLFGLLVPENAPDLVQNTAHLVPHSITNPWVLGVCGVLGASDFLLDKVWVSAWPLELINQILRPVFGTLVGLNLGLEAGWGSAAVNAGLGLVTSGAVSLGSGALTFASATVPIPGLQALRSLVNEFGALGLVVAALLLPLLAAILGVMAVILGLILFFVFRRVYRRAAGKFRDYRARREAARADRAARREASGREASGRGTAGGAGPEIVKTW